MPGNMLYASLARGFSSALRLAGIPIEWDTGTATLAFKAIKNPATAGPDGVDRNEGDDTRCILSALASDFPGGVMPEQGDSFTDAASDGETAYSYRIESIEYVPGHPIVHFHCANALSES